MTQLATVKSTAQVVVQPASARPPPDPSTSRLRDPTVRFPQKQSTFLVTAAGVVANYTAAKKQVLAEPLATNPGVITPYTAAPPMMQAPHNTSSSRPAAPATFTRVHAQPTLGPVIKPRFQSAQNSQQNKDDRYKTTSLIADWTDVDFADKDFLRLYF